MMMNLVLYNDNMCCTWSKLLVRVEEKWWLINVHGGGRHDPKTYA